MHDHLEGPTLGSVYGLQYWRSRATWAHWTLIHGRMAHGIGRPAHTTWAISFRTYLMRFFYFWIYLLI